MSTKSCTHCNVTKPITSFGARDNKCKTCCATLQKHKLEKRKAEGNCIRCVSPVSQGIFCDECKRKNNSRNTAKRQKAKDSGMCSNCCARPAKLGAKTCDMCLNQLIDRRKISQENGVCTLCHQRQATPQMTQCEECLVQKRLYSTDRREISQAIGICIICCIRSVTDGHVTCSQCIAHKADKRAVARQTGFCISCYNGKPVSGQRTCSKCLVQKKLGRIYNKEMILNWKAQHNNRCSCGCGVYLPLLLDGHHVDPNTKHNKLRGTSTRPPKPLCSLSRVDLRMEFPKMQPLFVMCHVKQTCIDLHRHDRQRPPAMQAKWDFTVIDRLSIGCQWPGGCDYAHLISHKHPCLLRYDHLIIAEKVANISDMVMDCNVSLHQLKTERSKCRVLCAAHERIHTCDQIKNGLFPTTLCTRVQMLHNLQTAPQEHEYDETIIVLDSVHIDDNNDGSTAIDVNEQEII